MTVAVFAPSVLSWSIPEYWFVSCVPAPATVIDWTTVAVFVPLVLVWKITQLWDAVALVSFSWHVALLLAVVDICTIVQSSGAVAEPPGWFDGEHWNELFGPYWRTCFAVVQVQPTPGQLGPA